MEEYALYKGEELLMIGTLEEIAVARGVQLNTIKFYLTPTYQRRIAKRKKPRNYLELVKLDDDE